MRVTFDISACNYYQKEGMQSLHCLVTQHRLNKSLSFLDQEKILKFLVFILLLVKNDPLLGHAFLLNGMMNFVFIFFNLQLFF